MNARQDIEKSVDLLTTAMQRHSLEFQILTGGAIRVSIPLWALLFIVPLSITQIHMSWVGIPSDSPAWGYMCLFYTTLWCYYLLWHWDQALNNRVTTLLIYFKTKGGAHGI